MLSERRPAWNSNSDLKSDQPGIAAPIVRQIDCVVFDVGYVFVRWFPILNDFDELTSRGTWDLSNPAQKISNCSFVGAIWKPVARSSSTTLLKMS
jgi:hypothetical protein